MKIRILASGETRHIDNSTGTALVSAGLAEALSADESTGKLPKYNPSANAEPEWEVLTVGITQQELVIKMTLLGGVYHYGGAPQNANRKIVWDGGFRYANSLGREIPKNILEQYTRQYKDSPSLRGPQPSSEPDIQDGLRSNVSMAAEMNQRNAR